MKINQRCVYLLLGVFTGTIVAGGSMPSFGSEPIKATIEFSKSLPALGDEYKEGGTFNLQTQKNAVQTLRWRRVPHWLAGVWHTESTTRWVDDIPVKYPTKGDFISGYQVDAKGHIWAPIINRVTRIDGGTYFEFQIPQGEQIYEVDKESSTRFTRSIRVRVSKASGRIVAAFQQEDKAITRPVEDGVVEAKADCCVFDKLGQKVLEQNISVVQQRTEPFHAIDTYGGIDFVKGLSDYLTAQGKQDLVPAAHETSAPDEMQAKILANEDQNSKLMEGVVK